MGNLMFHVRHNARPVLVKEVLQILDGSAPLTLEEIIDIGKKRGFQIGTSVRSTQSLKENPIQLARDLGLIFKDQYFLTDLGQQMVRLLSLKTAVFNEMVHVLHYTLWTPKKRNDYCFSWSYRILCELLWISSSGIVNRGQLVSQVSEIAMEKFKTNRVSFSKDSVRGVLQWLAELEPPVLENRTFTRRAFCPSETFALAVNFLYQTESAQYQTNLLLDSEKRNTICKVCFLEPTAFDDVFDWAAGQYDFLQRGTSGGWGSYILLTRQPRIRDFLG